ncbi:hypothetical protein B0H34DRAFT_8683 [Crassisporium funariophilum]|nr:hypothetical protein B0H34DRAFT_8683 [Crassisporium funariophilum]
MKKPECHASLSSKTKGKRRSAPPALCHYGDQSTRRFAGTIKLTNEPTWSIPVDIITSSPVRAAGSSPTGHLPVRKECGSRPHSNSSWTSKLLKMNLSPIFEDIHVFPNQLQSASTPFPKEENLTTAPVVDSSDSSYGEILDKVCFFRSRKLPSTG